MTMVLVICIQTWVCSRNFTTQVQEEYQEALDVLLLAEEAFDTCNPKHLDTIDNVGLLMIDIVWCVILLVSVPAVSPQ